MADPLEGAARPSRPPGAGGGGRRVDLAALMQGGWPSSLREVTAVHRVEIASCACAVVGVSKAGGSDACGSWIGG